MTYARFLGLFVVLPILFLLVRYRRTLSWRGLAPLGVLLVVVYVTTSPWDNMAVKWGLWGFDPERIWGVKLFYLPLEEYLFFGLQTLLVGLWARARLERVLNKQPESAPSAKQRPARAECTAEPTLGRREVSP